MTGDPLPRSRPIPTTGDPLDRIAERPVAQIPYSRDGTYVALTLVEREALVEVARAARETVDTTRVVLPQVGSIQFKVVALVQEWQDAAHSVADLAAALARLDGRT